MYSIETKKLTKKFKDKIAVNGIDLNIKQGELFALLGTNGAYHNSNIAILNKIFINGQCKTISDGNTYTCTDGSYNGDTKTNGYTSLHYETSCTIYGANSNTGKLICH